ncbi:hypothetical protein NL676_011372, partial [Syzygium grande]
QALRFLKEKASTSPSNLPSGTPPLPVIGNLLELGDLPHKSLAKLLLALMAPSSSSGSDP